MYTRQLSPALTHLEVRNLWDAEHFAEQEGRPLNATITVHPKLLDTYPDDVGLWVQKFLNALRVWCERRFGYYAIWTRENYEGPRREHLHVILHVPERHRADLEQAVERWLPGREGVVQVGRTQYRRDRTGRRVSQSLTYALKQMTPNAWFALDKRVRREKHNRDDHTPVAPVLGLRCGTSRSLNAKARRALWSAPRVDLTAPTAPPASRADDAA